MTRGLLFLFRMLFIFESNTFLWTTRVRACIPNGRLYCLRYYHFYMLFCRTLWLRGIVICFRNLVLIDQDYQYWTHYTHWNRMLANNIVDCYSDVQCLFSIISNVFFSRTTLPPFLYFSYIHLYFPQTKRKNIYNSQHFIL